MSLFGSEGSAQVLSPESWLQEASKIDLVHEHLVEQSRVLDALRAEIDKAPSEEITLYELDAGKVKLIAKDLGEISTTATTTKSADAASPFLGLLLNKWVGVVSPDNNEEISMEGFFERQQTADTFGYFRQEDEGYIYFGQTKLFAFDGPMMSSWPTGEKVVTVIRNGVAEGNSKCVMLHEIRYAYLKEGVFTPGSCLLVSPASKFKIYTKIDQDQKLDSQGVSTVILPTGQRISGKLINLGEDGRNLGAESSLYSGPLKNGLPSGRGILVLFAAGQVFEGEFSEGKLHGRGKYADYVRNEQFNGQFVHGKINGQGTHKAEGKWTYEGNFVDGKYEGVGTFLYEHQGKYSGEFSKGKFEGKGRLYTPDGDFIEGQFKDYLPDGPVKLKNAKGEEFTGKVQDGQLLSDSGIQLNGDIQKQLAEMARQRDELNAASNSPVNEGSTQSATVKFSGFSHKNLGNMATTKRNNNLDACITLDTPLFAFNRHMYPVPFRGFLQGLYFQRYLLPSKIFLNKTTSLFRTRRLRAILGFICITSLLEAPRR